MARISLSGRDEQVVIRLVETEGEAQRAKQQSGVEGTLETAADAISNPALCCSAFAATEARLAR
jgi:hypothetical protein